ncbi:MAG: hypothetical protein M1816_003496 [Peltula sp. TS41687]|nr:MAG: hypothetical protein M1816_003496 [Peltula sp. TS41687]
MRFSNLITALTWTFAISTISALPRPHGGWDWEEPESDSEGAPQTPQQMADHLYDICMTIKLGLNTPRTVPYSQMVVDRQSENCKMKSAYDVQTHTGKRVYPTDAKVAKVRRKIEEQYERIIREQQSYLPPPREPEKVPEQSNAMSLGQRVRQKVHRFESTLGRIVNAGNKANGGGVQGVPSFLKGVPEPMLPVGAL